ncbi:MAG: MarR family winged helix-turn-helix transcriptional regulator [Bradyrhizobium sp.]
MSKFVPSLTEEERAFARSMARALEPFRNVRSTMPLQYVYSFLLVAMAEGKSVSEYADDAGISRAVMTRQLLDIGDRNREGDVGFKLITQERDRNDLRRHNARITPAGKALMIQIIKALKTIPR